MKTLCCTLVIICFNFYLNAQRQTVPVQNIKYINEVMSNIEATKIDKMQNIVAGYNVKNIKDYDNREYSTYDVIFKETNSEIKARFNSDSEILNSIEIYTNMRLPLSLVKQIVLENANWSIVNNVQTIHYDHKNGSRNVYLITLKKGNQSKQLKFSFDKNMDSKTYAAVTN